MNNYMNYEWYRAGYMNNNQSENQDLFNPNEGFEKGNMFKNLYSEYKNYKPAVLNPMNEKEKLIFEISKICFSAHELNLYLDLHPENQSIYLLFMDYQKKANTLIEEYEKKYGPLNINSEDMNGKFTWESEKWPWEGRHV